MTEIRQLLQQGRHADAAAACRAALGQAPDSADLRLLMGLCEEAAGRPDSARAWMEKALEKMPEHAAAGFHCARLLLIEGRDPEARVILERCIAADPNHAAARTLLARIDQRAGATEAAIEGLRTALAADRDHAPAHAGLAVLMLRRGELDAAHMHATAALRLRPDDALTQVTMAQVFQAQGHMDFAEQCLRNALQKQPQHAQLRAALEQLERLRAAAGSAADGTDSVAAQLARMRTHYRQGQLPAAVALAELLQFRYPPSDPVVLELTEVLMDAGQLDPAQDLLARADSSLPRHALTTARLTAARGDMAAALAQLVVLFDAEQATIRHDARRLAADLHLRQRRLPEALAVMQPLAAAPDLPPATRRMLAQLEHAAGNTSAARKLLEGLLGDAELPELEQAVSHNLLGRMLDESGEFAAAAGHLARGGWRRPFLVEELDVLSPPRLQQAWQALGAWPFATTPVDDGRTAPCFISGWPGSGREVLLSALMDSGQLAMLPADGLMRRREILGLPADPDALARLSAADLQLGRKRYLLGAPQTGLGLVEPGQIEVTALPAVARFFPGARLIWMRAPEASLVLHWRLAGCRDIERMVDAWRAEQALFAHLAAHLPLQVLEVDLDALLAGAPAALEGLAEALTLGEDPPLGPSLASAFAQAGYRQPGHWQHYVEQGGSRLSHPRYTSPAEII